MSVFVKCFRLSTCHSGQSRARLIACLATVAPLLDVQATSPPQVQSPQGEEAHSTSEDDQDMDLKKLLQAVKDDQASPDFLSTPQPSTLEEHWTENKLPDKEDIEVKRAEEARDDDDMGAEKTEEKEEEEEENEEEVVEAKGKQGKRKASKGREAGLKRVWQQSDAKVLINLVDNAHDDEIQEVQQTQPAVHEYAGRESKAQRVRAARLLGMTNTELGMSVLLLLMFYAFD
jgi:hypothetical protein